MDKYSAAAHKWTDAQIAKLERELKQLYSQSYADIKKKSADILSKINMSPDMTAAQRYDEFRKYNRLQSLEAQVADILRDTNAEAVRIINGRMADVYSTNYSAATKLFPKDVVFPPLGKSAVKSVLTGQVTPFKQLAVDTLLSRAEIERELTRSLLTGIMQGESIPNLARRMKEITNKTLSESIRIARTETTRVENSAKQDVGTYGKEKLGFKMKKQWVSTKDGRTRPEHADADGQIVDIDKPFIVGGEELMYPGDEAGSAWNTINCRCTTINIIEKPNS
jgi:SPP1 gp7 family putative phage head morphogenesis protein